jgi:hypothetical protein
MTSVRSYLLLGFILLGCPLDTRAVDKPLPDSTKFRSDDKKFADLARTLQARNWFFDDIFTALCRAALTNVRTNPKLNIQDQARAIWGGMWLWTNKAIEPLPLFHAGGLGVHRGTADGKYDHGYDLVTLQKHYAQHFIAGGMFEAYFGAGREAGVYKERRNSVTGDYFDYNKVAVTSMGARWVDVALDGDAEHTRRWLELWATGQYTLSKSMPRLHWRSLAPFVGSRPEEVKAVEDEVDAAIKFPSDPNTPPPGPAKPQ